MPALIGVFESSCESSTLSRMSSLEMLAAIIWSVTPKSNREPVVTSRTETLTAIGDFTSAATRDVRSGVAALLGRPRTALGIDGCVANGFAGDPDVPSRLDAKPARTLTASAVTPSVTSIARSPSAQPPPAKLVMAHANVVLPPVLAPAECNRVAWVNLGGAAGIRASAEVRGAIEASSDRCASGQSGCWVPADLPAPVGC